MHAAFFILFYFLIFKHYMNVFMCNVFVEMFLADLTSCGLNLQFKMVMPYFPARKTHHDFFVRNFL